MKMKQNGLELFPIMTDAMAPIINIGDIAFIDKSINKLADGGIYLFATQDRILIRRVTLDFDGLITLSSANPIYPDAKMDPADVQIGVETQRSAKIVLVGSISWTIKKV
jgi:phage repressor protein C with HTH and peptisase S24 domain